MNPFARLFGKSEVKALNLTDPALFEALGGVTTSSGVQVSAQSAMRVPAVACAVALISETVGTLPVKLHDRDTKAAAKDHPAYSLVHDEANPWTSAEALRTQLTLDALMSDNGFAQVVRLSDGTPYELHRIDPTTVKQEKTADGEPFYIVNTINGPVTLNYHDILHITPFGGVSPIKLAREAIALAMAYEKHVAGVFANGARPSGIIKSEKILDVEAKKKIVASWFGSHARGNAGGTAILDEGMTYDRLSFSLADAQVAEGRVEQIREIARAFRVPPTMLFELSRGTWSNTEEMARQFLTVTLRPWLNAWAFAYARCLLNAEERKALYIEFNVEDLLSTSHAARATAYGQYRAMGVMTANEVRSGLNLPAHADGETLDNPHITTPDNTTPAQADAPGDAA
jgi:HK97 family phage portal protein